MTQHEDKATHHAKIRLKERFNIQLTPEVEKDLVARIKAHKPKVIWEIKNSNRTMYRMMVKNRLVDVLWDWRVGVIISCLPTNNWHRKEK